MTQDIGPKIDELIATKTSTDVIENREETLRQKLEVLLSLLRNRLTLQSKTTGEIHGHLWTLKTQLEDWEESFLRGLPAPVDKMQRAADSINRLDQEHRSRETDCWKDVVSIARDILTTWEALQSAKARSQMMREDGDEYSDDL